ncbi:biopolymer transporter ExbD [Tautonia plasticadhaerens]|nr:biopolymer transporter ExbD [Tautonia plasticadhaerens]
MRRTLPAVALLLTGSIAPADDFDRLEGRVLSGLVEGPGVVARDRLTLLDLAAMPNMLQGIRSPVLLVRTDLGNPSRVLISPGFRPAHPEDGADPDAPPELVPVLVLERFATFEAGGGSAPDRLAEGRGVILFGGFTFDLDSGQVVPEGQGGDLRFVVEDEGGGGQRLEAIGGASISTLQTPPEFPETAPGTPSPGRSILPGDYAGRYRLYADGSLSGTLDLDVEGRSVSGRFRSDQTGSSYEVRGEVEDGPDPPVRFSVQLPRTTQEYEGRLFSDGKGAMAGSLVMVDRERPFFALREGGRVVPEGKAVELP